MNNIRKFIHVDDEGQVEYCLSDPCPYGSFDNISEAFQHYVNRPKRRQQAKWPRGFKSIYSSSGNNHYARFKHIVLKPETQEYVNRFGYVLTKTNDMTERMTFTNNSTGNVRIVYAKGFGYSRHSSPSQEKGVIAVRGTKTVDDFEKNLETVVQAFQKVIHIYSNNGYLLMEQAYNKALENYNAKKDSNWTTSFLNESVTLQLALEHCEKRLDDERLGDNATKLTIESANVKSFLDLAAEIIRRTDILSEQTIKIFGSNDDYVIADLLRDAIKNH